MIQSNPQISNPQISNPMHKSPILKSSNTGLVYFLFFCSGLSGLVYQVVWVRVFGNVFGNTIYSTSIVVAVFMLGLGVGSYVAGEWADRRYAEQPESLLRAYGWFEIVIAAMGLGISALLPHLGPVSALVSSYAQDSNGWHVLSATSYLARAVFAVALLAPITLLMGGTLTLLIRHLVRGDVEASGWRIAVLYAVNTAGAALGCFLTDFALVPRAGLRGAQMVAVTFNVVAGIGALWLAGRRDSLTRARPAAGRAHALPAVAGSSSAPIAFVGVSLALTGFGAMGIELLWFRHVSLLLGGFRAVFALLLTVILIGIGAGAFAAGALQRRTVHPARWFMLVQALFVAATLLGIAVAGVAETDAIASSDLWFNAKPILLEAGIPALLMGFSFPLANALIQRAERSVGRRAGVLYLANTLGAVCGSLVAGFGLLPVLGIQRSATVLAGAAALAIVPLALFARKAAALSFLATAGALGLWLLLPHDYVIAHALPPAGANERVLTVSEDLTEVIAITEEPGQGRRLVTNAHSMSSTLPLAQRYMRALAHIPLLAMRDPRRVLVIGFGVGNTAHAASLHPSVQRLEVADLSRDILGHAGYFTDANRDVLSDPRLVVFVNDGRQHLQMQPPASYDLITLEPPPIAYAGVASLYSSEFYTLARTRLKSGGSISQWLPAYQVPVDSTLAMIRAFIDVFPQAVLLSGAEAELILIGARDTPIEIDPERLAAALSHAPAAQADLQRVDLGTVREIVGAFVGSAQTLAEATRDVEPVTDDRPIQEYGVRSLLDVNRGVPGSVVDLSQVAAWCPKCFEGREPVPLARGLDLHLALLDRAYSASPEEVAQARRAAGEARRLIAGSAYLGAVVPESAELHNFLGIDLASKGSLDAAIAEFREALRLEPHSGRTHWHLGSALAAAGRREEAIEHLRRSVQLDPGNADARHDLAALTTPRRR